MAIYTAGGVVQLPYRRLSGGQGFTHVAAAAAVVEQRADGRHLLHAQLRHIIPGTARVHPRLQLGASSSRPPLQEVEAVRQKARVGGVLKPGVSLPDQ